MKVIAVVNRRGGVGKTITTHTIGAGLMKKGFKVLFIDLDSQTNLTFDLRANDSNKNILSVLTGQCELEEAIQHTSEGDIVPAVEDLAGADIILNGLNNGIGKDIKLKKALKPVIDKDIYDYVVIDTPPALNILTINALTTANFVIVPAQAEIHSLQGIKQINDVIEAVKEDRNPNLFIKGILLTRYNGRAVLSSDMKENLEQTAKCYNTKLFSTPIRECIAVKEAQMMRTNIFDYAPKCNASLDYQELIEEILK